MGWEQSKGIIRELEFRMNGLDYEMWEMDVWFWNSEI